MHDIPRDLIHTDQFVKELEEIEKDIRRADEFLRGVTNLISRFPTEGKHRDTIKNIWAWAMNESPSVVIYYTFNEQNIWLLSIKKFEKEENNNGA